MDTIQTATAPTHWMEHASRLSDQILGLSHQVKVLEDKARRTKDNARLQQRAQHRLAERLRKKGREFNALLGAIKTTEMPLDAKARLRAVAIQDGVAPEAFEVAVRRVAGRLEGARIWVSRAPGEILTHRWGSDADRDFVVYLADAKVPPSREPLCVTATAAAARCACGLVEIRAL